ncbi:MAG: YmdB family metallophosphoesterase [Oscillospiraceae bacterium]|nr:YmdB family metallophosphoesterase [Oscillospiraceae bacterium]
MEFRVLAVGDVCGSSGLQLVQNRLRQLRRVHQVDFCVVNGENASVVGITPRQAEALLDAGADVITLGNHSYNRREIAPYLEENRYILRPANDSPLYPGRGLGVYDSKAGPLTVINLIGRCNMNFGPDNPFLLAERLLKTVDTRIILVDFHAEASSEKLAMGYHLDGKVSALWGTHTHVPTADDQVLPGGTGYVTDLGMTGPIHSVLGIRPEQSIASFRGGLSSRYETAPGPCKLEAVLFTLDSATGRCLETQRIFWRENNKTS